MVVINRIAYLREMIYQGVQVFVTVSIIPGTSVQKVKVFIDIRTQRSENKGKDKLRLATPEEKKKTRQRMAATPEEKQKTPQQMATQEKQKTRQRMATVEARQNDKIRLATVEEKLRLVSERPRFQPFVNGERLRHDVFRPQRELLNNCISLSQSA